MLNSIDQICEKLYGIIPPMITPLTSTGDDIDYVGLERLLITFIEAGVTGTFLLGSSGEGPWLSTQQQVELIRRTREVAGKKLLILVGILAPSTGEVIKRIKELQDLNLNIDAYVVTTPYYYSVPDSMILKHFQSIATDIVDPILLYNIPQMTHNYIAIEIIDELHKLPNIVGIKDSGGDWDYFNKLINYKGQGFKVFQGAERFSLSSLHATVDGLVPGLGNIAPELFVEMQQAVIHGYQQKAEELGNRLDKLWELHSYGYWLSCLKFAAKQLGYGDGGILYNGNILSLESQNQIKSILHAYQQSK